VKTWIHRLGSMKLGIGLLVLALVSMASGTIVESLRGSDAAMHAVYGAFWFRALLGLFGANLLFSLVDQFPWGRQKIGFLLTHGSMLIILVGALTTLAFKVEGHLALWEGEESASFATAPEGVSGGTSAPLPFTVRLESFEIDYYQGSRRPAMFRSRVMVVDRASGAQFPAVIEMNHELAYRGYRLFQSSYTETPGRDQTILAVSKDPGQPIVFLGYGLLVLGMTTVLLTRISQRRAASRALATPGTLTRPFAAALGAFLALAALTPARAASPLPAPGAATLADPTVVEALRRLPVQHDGRVMPLDTLAREAVLEVTGERRWQGMDPVAVAVGWASDPHAAVSAPVVRVGSRPLARRIGLPEGATHASFAALYGNASFRALIGELRAAQEADRAVHGVLADASKLEDRMVWLQGLLDGSSMAAVPGAGPVDAWSPPDGGASADALLAILRSPPRASFYPSDASIERELRYNRFRPSRVAWWILLAATALSILGWNLRSRWLDALALAGLMGGFGVMTWGLAVRWRIADRIPASNMYESMLFLAWGVGLFALLALIVLRNRIVILNATAMAALTMILVDVLPIDAFIHPVPPVLSGTPWLAIHVPIIMISYSVLALGVLIAHMQVGVEIFAPSKRQLATRMNDLLYWYLHVGSILLIAGIMTGSIWAASSWGRYWGWDPKEVWSLVAFLAYMAILHGRMDKLVGPLGVAALSIVAFLMILMTYIGVNFVLTAGLHSYGFGSSSVVTWLLLVAVLEAVFIGAGFAARSWRRPRTLAVPAS
jgi:cytochrome c-type biogenesis protein CcsB